MDSPIVQEALKQIDEKKPLTPNQRSAVISIGKEEAMKRVAQGVTTGMEGITHNGNTVEGDDDKFLTLGLYAIRQHQTIVKQQEEARQQLEQQQQAQAVVDRRIQAQSASDNVVPTNVFFRTETDDDGDVVFTSDRRIYNEERDLIKKADMIKKVNDSLAEIGQIKDRSDLDKISLLVEEAEEVLPRNSQTVKKLKKIFELVDKVQLKLDICNNVCSKFSRAACAFVTFGYAENCIVGLDRALNEARRFGIFQVVDYHDQTEVIDIDDPSYLSLGESIFTLRELSMAQQQYDILESSSRPAASSGVRLTKQEQDQLNFMPDNTAANAPKTFAKKTQGGGKSYNSIKDPKTGKLYNINGVKGMKLLNEYLKRL